MARHDEGVYCDVKFSSANGEKHICSLAPEHWRQAKAHTCYCGQVMDGMKGDYYTTESLPPEKPEPVIGTVTITVTGAALESFAYTRDGYTINMRRLS